MSLSGRTRYFKRGIESLAKDLVVLAVGEECNLKVIKYRQRELHVNYNNVVDHELGHALVAFLLGLKPEMILINPLSETTVYYLNGAFSKALALGEVICRGGSTDTDTCLVCLSGVSAYYHPEAYREERRTIQEKDIRQNIDRFWEDFSKPASIVHDFCVNTHLKGPSEDEIIGTLFELGKELSYFFQEEKVQRALKCLKRLFQKNKFLVRDANTLIRASLEEEGFTQKDFNELALKLRVMYFRVLFQKWWGQKEAEQASQGTA